MATAASAKVVAIKKDTRHSKAIIMAFIMVAASEEDTQAAAMGTGELAFGFSHQGLLGKLLGGYPFGL